jgi:uncharacterized protein YbbC (DUF1343 family)
MARPKVQTGLDRLLSEDLDRLAGKKVGLICNASTVTSELEHAADVLAAHPRVDLVQLFGPEHGIRGDAQDMIAVESSGVDPRTGLPVHSLYGAEESSLWPPPELVEPLDVVLWDIQDVGARYYTYVYTMAHMMEVAARTGTTVMCLDRPNPIGTHMVEGNIVDEDHRSFVGRYPIANRHGMTAGELARWFHHEAPSHDCELEVVEMRGWSPSMSFHETGLPWVLPSPNMPTPETALVYPGMCLFEGTLLSEGRGHTRPFEVVGAPFISGDRWAKDATRRLEAAGCTGFVLRPLTFRPTFHKHGGEPCGGVQVHVTDARLFRPLAVATGLLQSAWQLWPEESRWRTERYEYVESPIAIDLLAGDGSLREEIEAGRPLPEIRERWAQERAPFDDSRARHRIYRDEEA